MTWTRTPQEYPDRADVLAVPRSARWLLMEMYSWANAQLTDGRVPRAVLRRISDSEDLTGDVDALLREGLLEELEPGFLFLDWSNQEAAETVTARAARNVEKTKRARERKERHLAGDHSTCVAPYCKLGTLPSVTGNTEGNDTGKRKGKDTGKVTGSFTHIRSDPIRSVRSKGEERIRAGADSAGATSGPASMGGLNAQPIRPRRFQGVDVTPEMTGGRDPHGMTPEELELALGDWFYPDEADPADSLAGIIPADAADLEAAR
jgi:hypothetical protein